MVWDISSNTQSWKVRPGVVPVQAATVCCRGKEKVWLAQGKALRDPWPDVPHLLHTDNLRREVVRVESQLHVLSERKEMADLPSNVTRTHILLWMGTKEKKKLKRKWSVKTTHLELWNNQCSKHHDEMKRGQMVDGIQRDTHQTKRYDTAMLIPIKSTRKEIIKWAKSVT